MDIVNRNGRYYFRDGEAIFKMKGINHYTDRPGIDRVTGRDEYREYCSARYDSEEEWNRENSELLKRYGFNAVGAFSPYSGQGLYKTDILYLSGNEPGKATPKSDFFSKEWESFVRERIREQLPGKSIVYLENEMKIGRDWTSHRLSLAHGYLNMEAPAEGKRAVLRFVKRILRNHLGVWNAVTFRHFKTWQEALEHTGYTHILFLEGPILGFIMRKFYRTCKKEIRAKDPRVLIGGSRLISWFTPQEVLRACSKYCDFVSVNYYWARGYLHNLLPAAFGYVIPAGGLRRFYRIAQKPIYITEFGLIGKNGINKNSHPAIYKTYRNQSRRAKALARYLGRLHTDWLIGIDLFEFVDQPQNGRDMKDGENNNFGLISRKGKVYPLFAQTLQTFFQNAFR